VAASETRLTALVHDLQNDGRIDVAAAAARHGTAEMTIRRDLDQLVRRGVARRVRGGAVSLLARGDEVPYWTRELEAGPAKARIGQATAALLNDGEAVGLDGGSTAVQVARALADRRLTVMTTSLQTAVAVAEHGSVRLIVAGGEIRPGELTMNSPTAVDAIAGMRFDVAVIAACGLAGATVTAYDLGDAAAKRALIDASARVIVIGDATKFKRTGMAVVCGADRADVLVTEGDADPAALALWEHAGVDVIGA
jgi:DeoR/GlpR family transcriptional regulator of sugar metabolism